MYHASVATGEPDEKAVASVPRTAVYVRVLDERTDAWRPTTARLVSTATYELLPTPDYDPTSETWEFEPGTVVRCEWRDLRGGRCLVALRHVSGPTPRSDAHLKVIDPATASALRRNEKIAAWIFGLFLLGLATFFAIGAFSIAHTSGRGVITCVFGAAGVGVGAAMQRFHLLSLMGVLLMVIGAGLLVGSGVALLVR